MRGVVEFLREQISPQTADGKQTVRGRDRARLQGGQPRIGETIDVVHRAGEAGDQAALLEGRECISGNPVLGMPDIEIAAAGRFGPRALGST